MSLYVLDTDTFSLYRRGYPNLDTRIDSRPLGELAITVATVEEELAGWYTVLRQARAPDQEVRAYERLAEAIPLLARWQILPCRSPRSCDTNRSNA
jgi:tRNA(fMet)-specific endonuclease VapC